MGVVAGLSDTDRLESGALICGSGMVMGEGRIPEVAVGGAVGPCVACGGPFGGEKREMAMASVRASLVLCRGVGERE